MRLTDLQKIEVVQRYVKGENSVTIAEHFGIKPRSVISLLERRGIPRRRGFFFDKEYFATIDTPEKAYWLGFIYADGNIHRDMFALKLGHADLDHLKLFQKTLRAEQKIQMCTDRPAHVLKIGSKLLKKQLNDLGVYAAKSLTITYPMWLPFQRDFIRGFVDGDGWLTVFQPKDQNKKRCVVGICCASKAFIDQLHHQIQILCGTTGGGICEIQRTNKCYQLQFWGSDARKIASFLYQPHDVALCRKKIKSQQIANES